jgi:hypothetical protein
MKAGDADMGAHTHTKARAHSQEVSASRLKQLDTLCTTSLNMIRLRQHVTVQTRLTLGRHRS